MFPFLLCWWILLWASNDIVNKGLLLDEKHVAFYCMMMLIQSYKKIQSYNLSSSDSSHVALVTAIAIAGTFYLLHMHTQHTFSHLSGWSHCLCRWSETVTHDHYNVSSTCYTALLANAWLISLDLDFLLMKSHILFEAVIVNLYHPQCNL